MGPAANMLIHSFQTSALNVADQTGQHFEIPALLRLPLVLRARITLFFCETLAQLLFFALFFVPLFLALSTKVLRVSGSELFVRWSLDNSVSLDGWDFFAAVVRVDCVSINAAGVGDWIHVRRGIVYRRWRGKENGVHFYLTRGRN